MNNHFLSGCSLSCAWCMVVLTWTCLPQEQIGNFLYMSPVLDPMSWEQDAFQQSQFLRVSLFALLRQVLLRVMLSTNLSLVLVAPLWPQKEWFADLGEGPLKLPLL